MLPCLCLFVCFPQSCIISVYLKRLYFRQKYGLFSERVLTALRRSVCDHFNDTPSDWPTVGGDWPPVGGDWPPVGGDWPPVGKTG